MIAEAFGGWISNSLALIADAGHMLTDVAALTLTLFAYWFAGRPATSKKTYGFYRLEILAAFVNSLLLFGVAGYVLFEAVRRLQEPAEVLGGPMLVVSSSSRTVTPSKSW